MDDATRLRIIGALAIQVSAFTFTALMLVHGYAIGVSAIAASLSGLIAALTTRWTLKAIVPATVAGTMADGEGEVEDRRRSRVKSVRIPQPAARPDYDYDRVRPLR